jgi:mannitol/fructose-specific phosphotransferase system IIA component (Ntr-type)
MRSLSRLLSPQRIVRLSGRDRDAVLRELARVHTSLDDAVPLEETLRAIVEREQLNSTGIGQGLALPHARIQKTRNFSVLLGIHPEGVDFDSFDKEPVHIFLLIIGPTSENDMYVQILARASRFLRSKAQDIIANPNPDDVYAMTLEF